MILAQQWYMLFILLHTGVPDKIKGQNKLQYNAINLTAVRLTWGAPSDNNSPITGYIVLCDECPSRMVEPSVTDVVIDGLTPGKEYTFNVVAVNDIGNGSVSNTVMAQSANSSIVTNNK